MMPAGKCVTAMPEDTLSSVVHSLVTEKIGCVVVVDPSNDRPVGIVTKQDVNRMFLAQVRPATRAKRRARSAPRDEARPTRRSDLMLPISRIGMYLMWSPRRSRSSRVNLEVGI